MTVEAASRPVEAVRSASRQLVRELGFMGGCLAGTDLAPSAVHALIEIEKGGLTARDLAVLLRLDKSSVSRMLRRLRDAGDVAEQAGADGRVRILSLTASGRRRVASIHAFARAQVSLALDRLEPGQADRVLDGLCLYASALAAQPGSEVPLPGVQIVGGYRTGMIARITQMHAQFYARASGFGQPFESLVARELAEFCQRLESPRNGIWTAIRAGEIAGSVAIDGEDLGGSTAHLRWFIVDDGLRGTGAGRQLLLAALSFVDERDFAKTQLWTFEGLAAARHLYEAHGFVLEEERPGQRWGGPVLEQRFVRRRGQGAALHPEEVGPSASHRP